MRARDLPVLWICGPSCVGKSTTGWELYRDLAKSGITIAYVDTDQLGMCYPAKATDPEQHQVKARNIGAVLNNFQRAGARAAVVSGVVDPEWIHRYLSECSGSTITFCRLRLGRRDVLATRNRARGRDERQVAAALREVDSMDGSDFARAAVDTDGLDVAQVVQRVQDAVAGWAGGPATSGDQPPGEPDDAPLTTSKADGPILWLYGQPGVGKSTTGWSIFADARRERTAAYIDLGQLGFLRPAPKHDPDQHRLKAANLAALWSTYRAAGASCLTVSGTIERSDSLSHYRAALPEAAWTLCRLRASRSAIEERILERGEGGGPPLAGDALAGATAEVLQQAIEESMVKDQALDHSRISDQCVDTSAFTVEDAANAVRAVARVSGTLA